MYEVPPKRLEDGSGQSYWVADLSRAKTGTAEGHTSVTRRVIVFTTTTAFPIWTSFGNSFCDEM